MGDDEARGAVEERDGGEASPPHADIEALEGLEERDGDVDDAAAPAAPAPAGQSPSGPRRALRVKIVTSNAIELCAIPEGGEPAVGTHVVAPTRYGNELGRVLGVDEDAGAAELRPIVRTATPVDRARAEENREREARAWALCREKISARGLDMKLVSAHYLLDEQKILFLFTADNRVDFRELVKDLVAAFKTRIELRQIGVRDEARVVGGLGICGRALCCNSVTDRLRPVSIRMAKEQNLTLNSMKISGPCGRLLCCLSYEFDTYHEARASLPSMGTRVRHEGEEFRVVEVNILARRVRFQGESGRVLDVGQDALARNPSTNAWELKPRT